jgi:hypothetical protein
MSRLKVSDPEGVTGRTSMPNAATIIIHRRELLKYLERDRLHGRQPSGQRHRV